MVREIDWDRVFDLIQASKIPDWDKEHVAAAVVKAGGTWLARDRGDCGRVVATELYGEDPYPYKIDLILSHNERLTVVDWKAKKSGKLDDRWELRESRSWQPKIYAAACATKFGPEVFPLTYEVRGVTLEDKPQINTVKMILTRTEAVEAVRYLRGVSAMRDVLIERKHVPWVRDPSGCRCFGEFYKCEFEDICWDEQAPPGHDDEKVKRQLSHSSAQEFLRCPERYRLLRLMKKEEDEEAAAAGKAFHAAMEDVYSQLVSEETDGKGEPSKEVGGEDDC